MIETIISERIPAKYGRQAEIKLIDNDVVFDTSCEEYGPCKVPIWVLEKALSKHFNKLKDVRKSKKRRNEDRSV